MEASSTEWDWLGTGLKSEGKVKLFDPTKFTESQYFSCSFQKYKVWQWKSLRKWQLYQQ